VLGAPTKFLFERTVAGAVPESALSEIVELIHRVTGVQGEVSRVLDSVVWMGADSDGDRYINVILTCRGEQTEIRVGGSWEGLAATTYIITGVVGLFATLGISALIEPASIVSVGAVVAGGIGGTYLTARTLWRHLARQSENELRMLADQVEKAVATAVASEADTRVEVEPQQLPEQPTEIASPRPLTSPPQRT
jgi:hypothetical protein